MNIKASESFTVNLNESCKVSVNIIASMIGYWHKFKFEFELESKHDCDLVLTRM